MGERDTCAKPWVRTLQHLLADAAERLKLVPSSPCHPQKLKSVPRCRWTQLMLLAESKRFFQRARLGPFFSQ